MQAGSECRFNFFVWYNSYEVKSNPWVIALALRFFSIQLPVDILVIEAKGLTDEVKKKHPTVRHIAYIDDGSFSGNQVVDCLWKCLSLNNPDYSIHIIIPFMTKYAVDYITKKLANQVIIHKHQHVQSLIEKGLFDDRRASLFFDHKVPDARSVYPSLYSGNLLGNTGKSCKFISDTYSVPYRDL